MICKPQIRRNEFLKVAYKTYLSVAENSRMHLELQQPTNCNLTVLISSAEITFGKIVIQALMASSVRPPRNEQVVLPTS